MPTGPAEMPTPCHLHWGAEALWQQLKPLLPGLSVEVVALRGAIDALALALKSAARLVE